MPGKWIFGLAFRSLASLALLLPALCGAWAQGDLNEVHIQPRVSSASMAPPPGLNPSLLTGDKPIKADVDLVLVPVTVTDEASRLVVGLQKDQFQVFEGKQPLEIKHFSSEDAPVSIGLILDLSGSMKPKLDRAREAVGEFLRTANTLDEFFMITFSDTPRQAIDFTQSVDDVQARLAFAVPQGRTSLLDAIYLGLDKMKHAKYPRKALLIISDGGDNHSRYTEKEIENAVKEADTLIYAIGIYDRYFPSYEEVLGPELLADVSAVTGGRAFTIDNPNDLPDVAHYIGVELRNQYVLAYCPTHAVKNGKWRKIKVVLKLPKGLPRLLVRAKSGYYEASE